MRPAMASALCCTFPQRTGSPELPNARPLQTARGIVIQSAPAVGLAFTGLHPDQQEELLTIFDIDSHDPKDQAKPAASTAVKSVFTTLEQDDPEAPGLVKRLRRRLSKARTRSDQSTRETAKIQSQTSDPISLQTPEGDRIEEKPVPSLLNSGSRGGYDTDARSLLFCDTPTPFLQEPGRFRTPTILQDLREIEETSDQPHSTYYLYTPDANARIRGASQITVVHAPPRSEDGRGQADHEARLGGRRSRSDSHIGSVKTLRRSSSEMYTSASDHIAALQTLAAGLAKEAEKTRPAAEEKAGELLPISDEASVSVYESAASRIIDEDRSSSCPTPVRGESQQEMRAELQTSAVNGPDVHDGEESEDNVSAPPGPQPTPTEPLASSRASIHLWSMRISHHLRSGSAATANTSRTGSSGKDTMRPASSMSDLLSARKSAAQRRREQSSSGFASSKVPEAWGKVVHDANPSAYTTRSPTPAQSILSFYSSRDSPVKSANATVPPSLEDSTDVRPHAVEGAQTLRREDVLGLLHPRTTSESLPPPAQSSIDAPSRPASSRSSKEEDDTPGSKSKFLKRPSLFNLFRPSKSKAVVTSDNTTVSARYDGPADTPDSRHHSSRLNRASLQGNDEASNLFARALLANQEEKSALILPENRGKLNIPLHARRERSSSISSKSTMSVTGRDINKTRRHISRTSTMGPEPGTPTPSAQLGESTSIASRQAHPSHLESADRNAGGGSSKVAGISGAAAETIESGGSSDSSQTRDLGAWGRYPSHTLESRTGSAGEADNVKARDFALAAEQARGYRASSFNLDSSTSPRPTPTATRWVLRRERRRGAGGPTRLSKAKSMTLNARRAIAGYSQMFKSQSLEFMAHGHGHRTSISPGGALAKPELEMLPPVFLHTLPPTKPDGGGAIELRDISGPSTVGGRAQLDGCVERDSEEGLPVNRSAPDAAMIWSQLYASCVELPITRSASPSMAHGTPRCSHEYGRATLGRRSVSSPVSTRSTSPMPLGSQAADLLRSIHTPSLHDLTHPRSGACGWASGQRGFAGSNSRAQHVKRDSVVSSVTSLRDSTQDLCALLVEAEKRERERLLRAAEALSAVFQTTSPAS